MKSATVARLLNINRRFYLERGEDFADTRDRIQPGVRRVLQTVQRQETILDLGCGSGALARTLEQTGHRGRYLGLDFSPAALARARRDEYGFPATFLEAELHALDALEMRANSPSESPFEADWALVVAFSVLHHVPGSGLRKNLLERVRRWMNPDGRFILSNWQFSTSIRMRSRILPWSAAGLDETDVDRGDYLVDWRRGGLALRYVHEFRENELEELALESGFQVVESFFSDGVDRRSGLYQVWIKA